MLLRSAFKKYVPGLLLVSFLGLTGCENDAQWLLPEPPETEQPSPAAPDYWPTTAWQTADEAAHGFPAGAFDTLAADAAVALPYHTSLLVIKDGWLLHESYNSTPNVTSDADRKNHVWSVTKSVTSMTLGRAWTLGDLRVPDGLAASNVLDLTTGDIFPPAIMSTLPADDMRKTITLRNVLQMRSGLAWNEPAWLMSFSAMKDPLLRAYYGMAPACPAPPDSHFLACSILQQPLAYNPGTVWNYSTYDSYLISTFFTGITGHSLNQYAADNLFSHLGIAADTDWPNLPDPITYGGGLLNIRSRDLAKLGMLMLYDGRWDTEQLISKEWLTQTTSAQGPGLIATFDAMGEPAAAAPLDLYYGMQWWTKTGVMTGDDALTARGHAGQFMQIFKDKGLIILITSDADSYPETLPVRSSQINSFLKTSILDKL
ncbi:MAG: serine hydrolase domain-containing protein [Moraxellaceae bacterium]|nr:serine hydrolase domain-containing protein [Moraxellaceae bacterium]